jgi:hypothetical protein
VLTGWRAWLAGAAIFVVVAAALFVLAFVMLGVAITVGTILLIVVPIVIGIAIVASLFQSPRSR